MTRQRGFLVCACLVGFSFQAAGAAADDWPSVWIGYTELRCNLPGGRHANVRTMRATLARADGTGRKGVAESLLGEPDTWTQFVGWSPDGATAVVHQGWESPENARWEEEHRTFRFDADAWRLDSFLVDMASGKAINVTAVERVSHYNGGLFHMPDGRLGFTPLIDGKSKPYVMNADGRDKRDVSGSGKGFAYGYSASPDGSHISYHEDYQIFISRGDGSEKRKIETGNPFNFGPQWSPDGRWLLFVSGVHGRSNPHIVRSDGTGLRKLADLGGYQGWVAFLDVDDFHDGSSDLPVWSPDSKRVYYTARLDDRVELFATTLDGPPERLTTSAPGTLHYHPKPSPDGRFLAYGAKRDGIRRLHVMRLADRSERAITDNPIGHAAMWPSWQPTPAVPKR